MKSRTNNKAIYRRARVVTVHLGNPAAAPLPHPHPHPFPSPLDLFSANRLVVARVGLGFQIGFFGGSAHLGEN